MTVLDATSFAVLWKVSSNKHIRVGIIISHMIYIVIDVVVVDVFAG